jgi:hypothetical protein
MFFVMQLHPIVTFSFFQIFSQHLVLEHPQSHPSSEYETKTQNNTRQQVFCLCLNKT